MSKIIDLLNRYSGENQDLTPDTVGEVSFSDVASTDSVYEGAERASDMIEHAAKAEEIADGLNTLADKAEELADEDRDHIHTEQSLEGMQREFGLLMRIGNLSYKASSFESEMTPVGRAKGMAKDCRRIALSAQSHRNDVLNFSPEGAIMQTLGMDKWRMDSSISGLAEAISHFEKNKAKFDKGIVFTFEAFYRVMQRANTHRVDIKTEFGIDEKYVKDASTYITQYLSNLENGLSSGNIPEFDVSKLVTKPSGLLGNREVTTDLKYNNNSKASIRAIATTIQGATNSGIVGLILIGPFSGMALAAVGAGVTYRAVKDQGANAIHATVQDLIAVARGLIAMRGINTAINTLKKGGVELQLKKLKGENPEAYAKGTAEMAKVTKAIEAIYSHSKFLITSVGNLTEKALAAAVDVKEPGVGTTVPDQE